MDLFQYNWESDMKKNCKECFLKDCECECDTCVAVRPRNHTLSKLELTRLSIEAGLNESGLSDEKKQKVTRMLRGQGF
jgi:hypothetical protein